MGHQFTMEAESLLDQRFPVLDKGFISLVDYMGSDIRIAEAAWVSSLDEVEAEKKTEAARKKIINYLMSNHHTSPFEQVELVFRVRLPIFVARQWVRHRTANLNEMSGRYRMLPTESYIPTLERLGGKGLVNKQGTEGEIPTDVGGEIIRCMTVEQHELFDMYHWYSETGLANELARIDLPLSTYTEWYWKIDLHNLFHFLFLRLDDHAQWEIRQYANVMWDIVKKIVPMAAWAFEEYKLEAVTFSRTEALVLISMLGMLGRDWTDIPLAIRPSRRQISLLMDKLTKLTEKGHTRISEAEELYGKEVAQEAEEAVQEDQPVG